MCTTIPYLAASLHGIGKFKDNSWELEIKCSFSKYNSTLTEALEEKKIFLTKKKVAQLKRSHPLSNLSPNVLFMFEESGQCFSIFYDEHFVNSCLPQLKFFCCRAVCMYITHWFSLGHSCGQLVYRPRF